MSKRFKETTACPECGSDDCRHDGDFSDAYRECQQCGQEWFTTIDYEAWKSPVSYIVYTSLGQSLAPRDKNGQMKGFDKRSVKRRVKKLVKQGHTVTVKRSRYNKEGMATEEHKLVYSNWPVNVCDHIGVGI